MAIKTQSPRGDPKLSDLSRSMGCRRTGDIKMSCGCVKSQPICAMQTVSGDRTPNNALPREAADRQWISGSAEQGRGCFRHVKADQSPFRPIGIQILRIPPRRAIAALIARG